MGTTPRRRRRSERSRDTRPTTACTSTTPATQAGERMVNDWAATRAAHPGERVVMITDASNHELDQLNSKPKNTAPKPASSDRSASRSPDRPYGLAAGDEILFTAQHRIPGQQRVENGTRGRSLAADERDRRVTDPHRGAQPARRRRLHARVRRAAPRLRRSTSTKPKASPPTGPRPHRRLADRPRKRYVASPAHASKPTSTPAARTSATPGLDTDAIERLAERMRASHAQEASITRPGARRLEPRGARRSLGARPAQPR